MANPKVFTVTSKPCHTKSSSQESESNGVRFNEEKEETDNGATYSENKSDEIEKLIVPDSTSEGIPNSG